MSPAPSSPLASSLFLFSIIPALAKFTFQHTHASQPHTQIQFNCLSIGQTCLSIFPQNVSPQNLIAHQSTLAGKHHYISSPSSKAKRKLTLIFPSATALKTIISHQFALMIPFGSPLAVSSLLAILKSARSFKQFIDTPSTPASLADLTLKTRLLLEIATSSIAPYLEFSNDPLIKSLYIPDGTIHFSIQNSDIHIILHTYHRSLTLSTSPQLISSHPSHKNDLPTARIEFQSIHTAHAILTDTLSSSSALLEKQITLSGYIPLADALQTLMQRARIPLKQL